MKKLQFFGALGMLLFLASCGGSEATPTLKLTIGDEVILLDGAHLYWNWEGDYDEVDDDESNDATHRWAGFYLTDAEWGDEFSDWDPNETVGYEIYFDFLRPIGDPVSGKYDTYYYYENFVNGTTADYRGFYMSAYYGFNPANNTNNSYFNGTYKWVGTDDYFDGEQNYADMPVVTISGQEGSSKLTIKISKINLTDWTYAGSWSEAENGVDVTLEYTGNITHYDSKFIRSNRPRAPKK
jgi:hypothetical protein